MLLKQLNDCNSLPVTLVKVRGTRLLWRDASAGVAQSVSDAGFLEKFSYVTENGYFKSTSRLNLEVSVTTSAERYGGFGVGTNGGGARVANFNDAQIKGVGANALAGHNAPPSHSYGGLDIQGAIKEIIYSRLLGKISPVGTQAIEGLIWLDDHSALHNGKTAASVLMVREPVVRPAHFLPCAGFRPKPEHREMITSDYSRVLSIYKAASRHGLTSDLYTLIQNFLDKCADQMSFFRIARISHNALTPSNLSLDGRVLDTALCSFIVSGSNYGQVTCFFEEAIVPSLIAKEWFYLINKFCLQKPAQEHFLRLYEEKFYQYAQVNTGFVFAVDRETSVKLSGTHQWRKVSARVLSLLSIGSHEKTSILPTVDSVDFFNDILTASIFATLHNRSSEKVTKFLSEFIDDLNDLLTIMAASLGWHGADPQTFYRAFAIQVSKRAILSSYFFITYIGRTVDNCFETGNADSATRIIRENDEVGDWLYESLLSEHAILFSGNGISIGYSSAKDRFVFCDNQGTDTYFNTPISLMPMLEYYKHALVIQGYDCYAYIKHLIFLLEGDAKNSFNGVKNVFF